MKFFTCLSFLIILYGLGAVNALEPNACGGTRILASKIGDVCDPGAWRAGNCKVGELQCHGKDALLCMPTCKPINMLDLPDIPEDCEM